MSQRARINRRYVLGDTLMKTSGACWAAILGLALLTPYTIRSAPQDVAGPYAALMAAFGLGAISLWVAGLRIRKAAARMDRG